MTGTWTEPTGVVKIGWNVGRRIEVAPHYRRPHMALVWTGRGSVVHRELVEKAPSGFGE